MGGGVCENCGILFWEAPKSLPTVTAAIKLKDTGSLEGKVWPLLFKTGSLKTRRRHRACVSKMRWVFFFFLALNLHIVALLLVKEMKNLQTTLSCKDFLPRNLDVQTQNTYLRI